MLKKKKKKRRGSRFRCMRSLCTVFSGVKIVACQSQPTPQRVPGKEFVRAERERERVSILFRFSPFLLIVSVDLSDGFSKNENDDDKRENGHTYPRPRK